MRSVRTAVAILASALALQCQSSNNKTFTSIAQVYGSGTIAILSGDGDIRVDRVAGLSSSDSLDAGFEVAGYRVIEAGRLLTPDEAMTLRKILLEPRTYSRDPWACIFDPEFVFSLNQETNVLFVAMGTQCHQMSVSGADSTQGCDLTEHASQELQALCEGLFRQSTE